MRNKARNHLDVFSSIDLVVCQQYAASLQEQAIREVAHMVIKRGYCWTLGRG